MRHFQLQNNFIKNVDVKILANSCG